MLVAASKHSLIQLKFLKNFLIIYWNTFGESPLINLKKTNFLVLHIYIYIYIYIYVCNVRTYIFIYINSNITTVFQLEKF